MRSTIIVYLLFGGILVESCSSPAEKQTSAAVIPAESHSANDTKQISPRTEASGKERLPYPFGTILKMEVEIFDGDSLFTKEDGGTYHLKITSVEASPVKDTILLPFKDETGKFPSNDFELYRHIYGKEIGTISGDLIGEMKHAYVGKKFSIVAYETGEFTGLPDGYLKYQEVKAATGFHFRNYLIIISTTAL